MSRLSDKKKEKIIAELALNNNVSQVADKFNVARSTVRKIRDQNEDEFTTLRHLKKEEWISEAWKTINLYIAHVQSEEVIQKTGARDSAILIGTLHDKMLKTQELELKREEIEIKRKELEQKNKPPEMPNVNVYIDALKGEMKEVFDDE